MAIELLDVLKRVLTSAGRKRFFFAYAVGKRKDNKGEGALAVRTGKLKKPEVVAQLKEPGEYYEGFCWLSDQAESETIYFLSKGKKLSGQLITRMIKTAKLLAGRMYDFQLPSPEEEARGERLGSMDEEGPTTASAGAAPQTSAPLTGADLIRRLNLIAAAIKSAMAGPDKAHVQNLFVGVNTHLKAGEFTQAAELLAKLEQMVQPVPSPTASESAPPVPSPTASESAPPEGTPKPMPPNLVAWQSARANVIEQIRLVANAVADTKDPDAPKVILGLQSIIKNLTPSPTTEAQVLELEKYIADDLITAAEEVPPRYGTLHIRTTLRPALAGLKS